MKNFKYILIGVIFLFFLSGCQDIKKGFSGKKIDQGNEFLVIKKNPLVVPPNFNELPSPNSNNTSNNSNIEVSEKDNEFKSLLKKNDKKSIATEKNQYNSLEEKILNQINK